MAKKKSVTVKEEVVPVEVKPLRIDFGCGQNCTVGPDGVKFTGVDFVKCEGVDVVHDLTKFPYPFEDNSVDEIVSNHLVEHLDIDNTRGIVRDNLEKSKTFEEFKKNTLLALSDPSAPNNDFISHIEECYRILKPGGTIRLVHPYCFSTRAFQDPTHKNFIPAERYLYFDKNWREANKLDHYPIKSDFEYNIYVSYMDQKWQLKSQEALQFAMGHNVNVVADLIVNMKKR